MNTAGVFVQYFLLIVSPPLMAVMMVDSARNLEVLTTYKKACLIIMSIGWAAVVAAIYFESNHTDPRLCAAIAGGALFVAVFLACLVKMTKKQKG